MGNGILLIVWTFFGAYLLAGLSTTLIVRLTKGNKESVLKGVCRCANCGYIIPIYHQFPIISHLLSRGRCRSCGSKIPTVQLYLETSVFLVCDVIGIACGFSPKAFFYMGIAFFAAGMVVLSVCGRRKRDFWKQALLSCLMLIFDIVLFYMIACVLEILS